MYALYLIEAQHLARSAWAHTHAGNEFLNQTADGFACEHGPDKLKHATRVTVG